MTTTITILSSFIFGLLVARLIICIKDVFLRKKRKIGLDVPKDKNELIKEMVSAIPVKCECPFNQACLIFHETRTNDAFERVSKLIQDNIKKDLKL